MKGQAELKYDNEKKKRKKLHHINLKNTIRANNTLAGNVQNKQKKCRNYRRQHIKQ